MVFSWMTSLKLTQIKMVPHGKHHLSKKASNYLLNNLKFFLKVGVTSEQKKNELITSSPSKVG